MTLGESLFAVIWKAEKLEEDDNNNKDRHARTHTHRTCQDKRERLD